jgi:hypothetical protein
MLFLGVLAFVASSTFAASLVEVGTSMNAVSGDGAYAVGRVAHETYAHVPAAYEIATKTLDVKANKGSGELTGVGSNPGAYGGNAGSGEYVYANFIGRYGAAWNAGLSTAAPSSECLVWDAVEDGSDYYLCGEDTKSASGIRWSPNGATFTRINGIAGETKWKGVATNGHMVGQDRHGGTGT